MQRVPLGRTEMEVSRLCLGCWQAAGWATSDDSRFIKTVHRALDLGINFLDTAASYGKGHSEELVAKAIKGQRHDVVLATKARFKKSRPDDMRLELESSLRRLKTDYIDLYQQHWPPKDVPLADTVGALETFKREGKIRAIGVSNWMEPEWESCEHPERIDVLQPNYSLLWRSIEAHVMPLCQKNDIAMIAYSPLCQGILAGKFWDLENIPPDPRRQNRRLSPEEFPAVKTFLHQLQAVAKKVGKTMGQTAIRWILDQPGITSAIVGASHPDQVVENVQAEGWQLEEEDRQHLADASWPLSEDLDPHESLWNWHPKGTPTRD